MKKLLIYALLFLLPLAACKKYTYPDDPKKSWKKPKARLIGRWYISEYTLNGVSIKDTLGKIIGADISLCNIDYHLDYDDNWRLDINGNFGHYIDSDAFDDYHYIKLQNAKYYSGLYIPDNFNKLLVTPFKSVLSPTTVQWAVTKLYDKDLNLQLTTDTGEYRIVFIKK